MRLRFVLCLLLAISSGASATEQWHLAQDEDGIQVYLSEVPGSPYQQFRGVALIKASVSTLSELQENLRVACKWLYGCADMRLLKVEGDSTWVYLTTALPWPASTRDMVIQVQSERRDDGSLVRRIKAVPGMVKHVPGQIRVRQLQGLWTFVPKGEQLTEVTYQLQADPAGDIPSWLANQFVLDAPNVSLRTLRAVAERQGGSAPGR
ncbi:START domain-containing protein [Pseudomonas sp. BIGb0427]|uniref:START domain-containing protein n=1 Tax=unclassified Pseudomonas TaxID=196821 RepID=UPI0016B55C5D|nr:MULTISPECIES: START domain-containing protein [unclassified Pseudomonas]NLU59034.1 START domain-containing protein [Pseudomonas sp. BIGb0427]QPG62633.1 START domain-containing protein [Pseudomonas sp. BIGb0427]UVM64979.1 START domain-containing protein [Pseudomonas sp. B21-009]